jgi:hypothetical protein
MQCGGEKEGFAVQKLVEDGFPGEEVLSGLESSLAFVAVF